MPFELANTHIRCIHEGHVAMMSLQKQRLYFKISFETSEIASCMSHAFGASL